MPPGDAVLVATIVGSWGVDGAVCLRCHMETPAALIRYCPLTAAEETRIDSVEIIHARQDVAIARFSIIQHQQQAEHLAGTDLFAPRERLPSPNDEEFYHTDLIGVGVYDLSGRLLGQVRAVHNHGAGDLPEISHDNWKGSTLLPFTRAVVPHVDLHRQRIVVCPPAGSMQSFRSLGKGR